MPPLVLQERYSVRKNDFAPLIECDDLLRELIAQGGPMPSDYAQMNRTLRLLGDVT